LKNHKNPALKKALKTERKKTLQIPKKEVKKIYSQDKKLYFIQ
jgi:hypothetical protein